MSDVMAWMDATAAEGRLPVVVILDHGFAQVPLTLSDGALIGALSSSRPLRGWVATVGIQAAERACRG